MLSLQHSAGKRARDQGEKPFWISFSDLMSALMVLFLVAMSVALLAVTKKQSDEEREVKERSAAIARLMDDISKSALRRGCASATAPSTSVLGASSNGRVRTRFRPISGTL